MTTRCSDIVETPTMRRTRDGYLTVEARIARSGIQVYRGLEVDRPQMSDVRVYRPPEEVFHADALASMAHRPVTIDHPTEDVTAANWRTHARGYTGDRVSREGDFVVVPLVLMDGAAITEVESGKRQLSVGYTCTLDWTPGTTPDGETYDAIQRDIRGNHLAVVAAGRAGPACRIGDDAWNATTDTKETAPVSDKTVKTMTIDGVPIDVTDAASAVIGKLQGQAADLTKALADAKTSLSAKDGELEALKAQKADLEKKIAEAEANADKKAEDRLATIATANAIVGRDLDTKGKTTAQIKRDALAARLGDAAVKDRDDAFVDGAFVALASSVNDDPYARAVKDAGGVGSSNVDKSRKSYIDHLTNAWKGVPNKAA